MINRKKSNTLIFLTVQFLIRKLQIFEILRQRHGISHYTDITRLLFKRFDIDNIYTIERQN